MLAKVKLRTKLAAGFGTISLLLLIMAVIAAIELKEFGDTVDKLSLDRIPKILRAYDMVDTVNDNVLSMHSMAATTDKAQIQKEAEQIEADKKSVADNLEFLKKTIVSDKGKEILRKVIEAREAYLPAQDELVKLFLEGKKKEADALLDKKLMPLQENFNKVTEEMVAFQQKMAEDLAKETSNMDHSAIMVLAILAGIALLMAVGVSIFLTRGITRPINEVVSGLTQGAEQVASASLQVSSASQALAEGASEQAAGLEETSSSIAEMASITKQNAENAGQADSLMAETSGVVDQANRSMAELTESMKEISAASEETAKIIKTIDEIAFQTNLLALNAAVEAARAGEAGAGFAVVADEVRNLALRAAEAAKNTAGLIEGTVKKIKNGSDIVNRTNEAFARVSSGAEKVGSLVAGITTASREQAQGIEQINKAVSEMDSVVQKNASGAEESASAAEEMSGQAEQMKDFVQKLAALVNGGSAAGSGSRAVSGREKGGARATGLPALLKRRAASSDPGGAEKVIQEKADASRSPEEAAFKSF